MDVAMPNVPGLKITPMGTTNRHFPSTLKAKERIALPATLMEMRPHSCRGGLAFQTLMPAGDSFGWQKVRMPGSPIPTNPGPILGLLCQAAGLSGN
jgi:hypothetical protein